MFHQTFSPDDLLLVLLLVVLEGMLSMDNAVVLGLMASRLPSRSRGKALTYGLGGSVIFRTAALAMASMLLRWRGVQLVGGVFLILVALRHLRSHRGQPVDRSGVENDGGEGRGEPDGKATFWRTVGLIELTDILFAVDSILAAVALIGPAPAGTPADQPNPKLWVVVVGGMGGVVLMRFAAFIFIKLLERFPGLETSAYLMVIVIGVKMVMAYFLNGNRPSVGLERFNHLGDWTFWGLMVALLALGFVRRRSSPERLAKTVD